MPPLNLCSVRWNHVLPQSLVQAMQLLWVRWCVSSSAIIRNITGQLWAKPCPYLKKLDLGFANGGPKS